MIRRREPCRNFQRGSCQYGDRCKFLHVTQQQTKPNPFGFGSQSTSQLLQTNQQAKPNTFGFGVQDAAQSRGQNNFGARNQNSSQSFENKWIRPAAATNSTSSQQADNKKQAGAHECTDPESCKRQIADDFENEAPLWKLTCYGHFKYLPCDIVGDTNFEELRANAYEDANKGLSLQSIVERERKLLNSKLAEFNNLLQAPYVIRSSSSGALNPFSLSGNTLMVSPFSNKPSAFSSFSQLGASASVAPTLSFGNQLSAAPSNTVFGQPSFSKSASQFSGGSDINFGVSGAFVGRIPMQPFGASPKPNNFGSSNGTVGDQLPLQQSANSPGPSNSGIINGFMTLGREQSSLHSISPQISDSSSSLSARFIDGALIHKSAANQEPAMIRQDFDADDAIWSKEWDVGEIPEEEPPERVCLDIFHQTRIR